MISLLQGDARHIPLVDGCVQTVITSPPYWALRDYGVNGQIGLESTPEEYIEKLVGVFREVWRVLRPDGTVWLNLGDSYAGSWGNYGARAGKQRERHVEKYVRHAWDEYVQRPPTSHRGLLGLKPKDLVGIPWRVALALQANGWYLRSDIIWSKPNPMPESVTDRPTQSHEYVFLLTKSERYYYDAEAICEPVSSNTHARISQDLAKQVGSFRANGGNKTNGPMKAVLRGSTRKLAEAGSGIKANRSMESALVLLVDKRNRRTVWHIPSQSFSGAHFATFPEALVEPCVLAGTSQAGMCAECGKPWKRIVERESMIIDRSERTHELGRTRTSGTMVKPARATTLGWSSSCVCNCEAPPQPCIVLDPFMGTATVGKVALKHRRSFVGLDLKWDYIQLARQRTSEVQPYLHAT